MSDDLLLMINMKDYIISVAYANLEDEWENKKIEEKYDLVITSSDSVNPLDIERNFYSLCGLMEDNGSKDPAQYSVLRFYSKLNYINEKTKRETQQSQEYE